MRDIEDAKSSAPVGKGSPGGAKAQRGGPDGARFEPLKVLPTDHLVASGLVLDLGAIGSGLEGSDSPAKPRRGRPPGKKMRLVAESLRHQHFSFLRANIEGVRNLRWCWEQYLSFEGGPDDERHFQMRLRELTSVVRFAAAERGMAKQAEIAFAALDLRPPSAAARPDAGANPAAAAVTEEIRPSVPTPALPSLDEWIEEQCVVKGWSYDDMRQSEWLELYEEEFGLDQPPIPVAVNTMLGADGPEEKPPALGQLASPVSSEPAVGASSPPIKGETGAARTVADRIENLNQLAYELSRPPALSDKLSSWLTAEMTKRLASTAVKGKSMPLLTLQNLIDFINLFGNRWWVHVPRLGEQRAHRLMSWLDPQAQELERPLNEAARVTHSTRVKNQLLARKSAVVRLGPDANRRFGLVPLERLAVPKDLDGSVATFRAKAPNTMGVDTDLAAIFAWLDRRRDTPKTLQQYGRMLERFYLWCLWVKKRPIGDLVERDFVDYKEFLKKPPADWVNASMVRRDMDDWRPLRGPQNENSLRQNFAVINAFLNSLHKAQYLTAQAAAGMMPGLKLKQLRINIDRSFDEAQWRWVMQCLDGRVKAAQEHETNALAAAKLTGRPVKSSFNLRLALLRRQRLVLELGATTGLRLIELVTTRRGAISRVEVDGESVWLAKVTGKGNKVREVLIYDDIKELIDLHHADMDAAGTSFSSKNMRVRTVQNPDAKETIEDPVAEAPAFKDYSPEADSGLVWLPSEPSPPLSQDTWLGDALDDRMRPLVGALGTGVKRKDDYSSSHNPSSTSSGALGTPPEALNSDRYGSLDPNGLRQSLKRFLASCADEALRAGPEIDAERLREASTHWLRHFFANSAASDGVSPTGLMEALGHSSLATTTVYLRQERKRLVTEMGKMKRR